MKRTSFLILILLSVVASGPGSVRAQDAVFPLPAPLYILTSEYQLLHVNPQTGEQTLVSPEEQRMADFDLAPDGAWYAYRTWENNAVIVSELWTGNGYVVEFSDSPPRAGSPARTIAWSPDVSALAYVVQDGVRIAELGAADYGGPLFSTVQGPWVEMYWADNETLIASDEGGNTWRVSGTHEQWTVEAVSGVAMREQPPIPSYLTAEGVVLGAEAVIPRTAGTVAFEWGPPPLPVVAGLAMHTDLYFQATDANGAAQVWQLPRSGEPPRPLTTGSVSVTSYAIAPDHGRMAYIVEDELIVADLDGARQRLVATLQPGYFPSSVAWNPDGTRLAFHDGRGVWTVPADGFRPQNLLAASHPPSENQADAANVKVYFYPRWSPDGTRLLVRIGFWEGSILGVIDAASGVVTELPRVVGSAGDWTGDGRVIAWSSSWGYASPGLFLLDPAEPEAEPVAVLKSGTPVVDAERRAQGDWLVLVASSAEMGPQYMHVLGAATLDGPFLPVAGNTAGGFVSVPQISAPAQGGTILAAGLGGMAYDEAGLASGDLVILNMSTGDTVQIQTSGPVWNIQWGQ